MSQNHVPRSNPCYQAVVSVLEERGIKHTIKYGGRHPLIMFKYAGYHLQKPFASTTVNRNASRVSEREMRRLLATADAGKVLAGNIAGSAKDETAPSTVSRAKRGSKDTPMLSIFGRERHDKVEVETRYTPRVDDGGVETPHTKVFRLVQERRYEDAAKQAKRLIDDGNIEPFFIYRGSPDYQRQKAWFDTMVSDGRHDKPAEWRRVTPVLAQFLLERNPQNRDIHPGGLASWMRAMVEGRWDENGETIKVSAEGTLNDGQHRNWSSVLTGSTYTSLFVFGLKRETRMTNDIGIKRGGGARLAMAGVASPLIKASIVALSFRVMNGRNGTDIEHDDLYWSDADLFDLAASLGYYSYPAKGTRAPFAVGIYILLKKGANIDAVREFVDAIRTGANLSPGSYLLKLRNAITTGTEKRSREEWVRIVIAHYNGWRNGQKLRAALEIPAVLPPVVTI